MPQPSLLSYRATCLESADLGSVLHFSPLQLSRWTSDAWLAAFIWQLWLNTWLQPPDENITSSKQKARSSSSEPAAAFLNRRFFCAVSPGKSPLPSNFPHYMPLCTAPGRHTLTHTFTHRCICSRHFSQSAPSSITRGRCYSHNGLASSALTRRPVLLSSIMSRKLQFPHVSYRELWHALIEYSWYFPCSRYCPRSRDSFCDKLT